MLGRSTALAERAANNNRAVIGISRVFFHHLFEIPRPQLPFASEGVKGGFVKAEQGSPLLCHRSPERFFFFNERRTSSNGNCETKLPDLFLVMATQSPIEQDGTHPLPEAQLDRFLMHVFVGYVDNKSEEDIMLLVRGEEENDQSVSVSQRKLIPQDVIFSARSEMHRIHVSDAVANYIVALVAATRYTDRYGDDLKKWIQVGASPRGTIGFDKCSRVYAWLQRRDCVRLSNAGDAELTREVESLMSILYRRPGVTVWSGNRMVAALVRVRTHQHRQARSYSSLPALNPGN